MQGRPSVRVVLLKGYDERGFVFYTNYSSRKGGELVGGAAAFAIYYEKLQRQIRCGSGSNSLGTAAAAAGPLCSGAVAGPPAPAPPHHPHARSRSNPP